MKKQQLNVKLDPKVISRLKYTKKNNDDKTIQITLTNAINHWFKISNKLD